MGWRAERGKRLRRTSALLGTRSTGEPSRTSTQGEQAGVSELYIEIRGEKSNDPRVVGQVIAAVDDLYRAVSKETIGREIGLQLVAFGFRCDGCQRKVKKLPKSWVKRGADDLCPRCASNADTKADGSDERSVLLGLRESLLALCLIGLAACLGRVRQA